MKQPKARCKALSSLLVTSSGKQKESTAFLCFNMLGWEVVGGGGRLGNSERSQMAKAAGRERSGEVHTCLKRLQIMKGGARVGVIIVRIAAYQNVTNTEASSR